jgi:hypothetical protein
VNSASSPAPDPVAELVGNAAILKALAVFLEAHEFARECREDDWEFAVELSALLEAGCSRSTLRWLAWRGHIEHAVETTRPLGPRRSFRRAANLSFASKTCFILTPSGIAMARQAEETLDNAAPPSVNGVARPAASADGPTIPYWDSSLRELRLGPLLIKAFSQPSQNQETILAVFQEEGWPVRIDNPLPPQPDRDGRRRLHDAITRLNRHQKRRLLRFHSDNNGDGVRWNIVPAERPPATRVQEPV